MNKMLAGLLLGGALVVSVNNWLPTEARMAENELLPVEATSAQIEDEFLPVDVRQAAIQDEYLPADVRQAAIEDEFLPVDARTAQIDDDQVLPVDARFA